MPPPPAQSPAFIVKGDDDEEYGPVELEELREWVRENRAGLGTVVRLDEPDALWQPWQYYPELVALLAEKQSGAAGAAQPDAVMAPMGRRMVAFAIDMALFNILMLPVLLTGLVVYLPDVFVHWWALSSQGAYVPLLLPPPYDTALNLVVCGGLTLYMAGFHCAHGKTPGKAILRLRVVDQNGQKPDAFRALTRGLVLSLSLCLLFLPLLCVFLIPQRRAIHDLMAGTFVVEA
jgi:uncharacterized RDD family membrane protein YckC